MKLLVPQKALQSEEFLLITNRFDLKTYQIIMLYAYRWQVELFFRYLKRTFNGIHLMSHDPKGVEIHFSLHLIVYFLLLIFKQTEVPVEEKMAEKILYEEPQPEEKPIAEQVPLEEETTAENTLYEEQQVEQVPFPKERTTENTPSFFAKHALSLLEFVCVTSVTYLTN